MMRWRLYRRLLAHSLRPILVGPWRGEVGFEVLYWLPWLRAFRKQYHIAPQRIIPIPGGGAGVWYDVPKAVDLYGMRTPQEIRVENTLSFNQHGSMKQYRMTAWDRAVIRDAAETLKLRRYWVLSPGWMFRQLEVFWQGKVGAQLLGPTVTDFRKLALPPLPARL